MKAKDYRKEVEKNLATESAVALESIRKEPSLQESLTILADKTQSNAVRQSALGFLSAASFSKPEFSAVRAEFLDALRSLAFEEASEKELRHQALSILANENDAETQEKLRAVLGSDAKSDISKAEALRLLAQDDHANAVVHARQMLDNSTDVEERQEAIRSLTADPDAVAKLSEVLKNSSEDAAARVIAAQSLQHLDTSKFAEYAIPLISNAAESDDLRASLMASLSNICDLLDDKTRQSLESNLANLSAQSTYVENAAQRLRGCLANLQEAAVGLEAVARPSALTVTKKFDD